ncbi:hypothetical protein [Spiroplasma culicicola]|uniref:hypothetical protein n=1 Tax=Spiroplasma culicicola TaxID=216935 RepID=UPI0011DCF2A3|nr:hypothetical protein [Spiroplasma culicicola]
MVQLADKLKKVWKYIKSDCTDYNTCIGIAIDEHNEIFVDNTITRKLQVKYVEKALTNELIEQGSTLQICNHSIKELLHKQDHKI